MPSSPARIPVHSNSFRAEYSMAYELPCLANTASLGEVVAQQWHGQTSQHRAMGCGGARRSRRDKIRGFAHFSRSDGVREKLFGAGDVVAGQLQAVTGRESKHGIQKGEPVGIYLDLGDGVTNRIPHIRAGGKEPLLWDSKTPIRVLEENVAEASYGGTGWE